MAWDRAGAWNSGGFIPNISGGATLVTGQLLLPNGSVAVPSLAFVSTPNTGFYLPSGNTLDLVIGGSLVLRTVPDRFWLVNDSGYFALGNGADVQLWRDAANILALKNANDEQQFNIYSGNGAYGLIRSKQELVTTAAAATAVTAAGFIPDGAVPLAISTYVETAISGGALTGYTIGDGTTANRWGAIAGHAVGTKSNNSDWTVTTIQAFIAAQAITLTATGADFPAGGKIRVCMTYVASKEPTS